MHCCELRNLLRRGDAGLKDGCAHVSSVLGSAVSQVHPHFPRFAKTLHHFPSTHETRFILQIKSLRFLCMYCDVSDFTYASLWCGYLLVSLSSYICVRAEQYTRLPSQSGTARSSQVPPELALDRHGASTGPNLFMLPRYQGRY